MKSARERQRSRRPGRACKPFTPPRRGPVPARTFLVPNHSWELIGDLERADDGNPDLDERVAVLVGWQAEKVGENPDVYEWTDPDKTHVLDHPPPLSWSVDDCLAEIPQGWYLDLNQFGDGCWAATLWSSKGKIFSWDIRTGLIYAPTAALAICLVLARYHYNQLARRGGAE